MVPAASGALAKLHVPDPEETPLRKAQMVAVAKGVAEATADTAEAARRLHSRRLEPAVAEEEEAVAVGREDGDSAALRPRFPVGWFPCKRPDLPVVSISARSYV